MTNDPQDSDSPQKADCPSAPCSPSSLTPETDAMLEADWYRLEEYSAPLSAYKRMTELSRTLERERDEARSIAAHWRDIAAGPFAKDGLFPWENA